MKTLKERIDVKAPQLEAFDYAQHYANRKTWDPFIARLEPRDVKERPSKGEHVRVTAWQGLNMTCEYLKYDRPKCVTIKMTDGPRFLKSFAGTWRFVYLDSEQTAVIFLYTFEMTPLWQWMHPVVEGYFRWDMKRRLKALKTVLEEEVDVFEVLEQKLTA